MELIGGKYIAFDFSDEHLVGCILSGTFIDCDFRGANLTGATLNGTFVGCDFRGVCAYDVSVRPGAFTACLFDDEG